MWAMQKARCTEESKMEAYGWAWGRGAFFTLKM